MKVDRTLRTLECLAEGLTPMGVLELSAALGEPPPSLHRTLQVLVEHDLVVQDSDTKRYRLGPAILRLADACRQQSRLVTVAQPVLDSLRSELHEAVFLCELIDGRAVVVAVAESPRPLRSFMRLGQRMPFHAASSARAILAFQDPSCIQRLLQVDTLDRYTSRTKTGLGELQQELDLTRRRGYAVCDQEMEIGVKAIARPIRDSTGGVIGSVAVMAPRERLAGSGRGQGLRALAEAASSISVGLGYRPQAVSPQRLMSPALDEGSIAKSGLLPKRR
jgi:IclR family acetate operon transcriptional repressor